MFLIALALVTGLLTALVRHQAGIENQLRAARKDQTRSALEVSKQEKAAKKQEKGLEETVSTSFTHLGYG